MIPLGILASSVRRASAALLAPTDVTSTLLINQVLLTWTDRNTNETGHRIYRSSSPMDTQALPLPVAEIGPDVTEWEDTDTPVDQVVYYIVSAVRGADEAFSDEVMIDTTSPAPDLPTIIGESFGGGFYAGDIEIEGQWYKLIVADVSADITGANSRWKTSNTDTPGTDHLTDGVANTSAMIAAGIELHPAAAHCIDHRGGGNADWYMPAKDELNVIYQNLDYGRPNCPPDFLSGGPQAFTNAWYWASTQYSSDLGWSQLFGGGNQGSNSKPGSNRRVRPVRRLQFNP